MSNLGLWNKVKSIPSQYTKNAKLNGQEITTYSVQSVILMATEQFGMFGKGWGYSIVEERLDEGSVIVQASTYEDANGKHIHSTEIKELTHTLVMSFWYVLDGEKIECPPAVGHTPYLYGSKYGPKHDNEYYKKSLSDALKKSLSMLGFGADIYLGLNDDPVYKQMIAEEQELKRAAEVPERIEQFNERVKQMIKMFSENSHPHSLKAMFDNYMLEVGKTCHQLGLPPARYQEKVTAAYNNRIEQLKNGDTK